jgi:hypothetical protein
MCAPFLAQRPFPRPALAAIAALAAALALSPRGAVAAEGVNAHLFHPPADGLGIATLTGAETLPPFAAFAGVFYDRAWDPVELETAAGDRLHDIVDHMDVLSLTGAIGLPAGFEAALTVPVVVDEQAGDTPSPAGASLGGAGFADVRGDLRWRLATFGAERRAALALDLFATAPSGDPSRYRGEDRRWTAGGILSFEYRLKSFRAIADLGYQWLDGEIRFDHALVDDRLIAAIGAAYTLFRDRGYRSAAAPPSVKVPGLAPESGAGRPLQLDAEVALQSLFRAGNPRVERTAPIEMYAGLRLDTPIGLVFWVGASGGLTEAIGAPDVRLFFGMGYTFGAAPRQDWRFAP